MQNSKQISVIYLEHASLIDRQTQPRFIKAIDQTCDVISQEAVSLAEMVSRKYSNNVAPHDETPVKATFLRRNMSFISPKSDITL